MGHKLLVGCGAKISLVLAPTCLFRHMQCVDQHMHRVQQKVGGVICQPEDKDTQSEHMCHVQSTG